MVARNGLLITLAFAGFAVAHSLAAGVAPRQRLKGALDDRLVEGWYRLAYNLFSVVTLLPVLALLVLLPDRVLYSVQGAARWLMRAAQFVGLLGFAGALLVTDVGRFTGLKQAAAYLRGDPLPLPELELVIRGMYRFTRHPLYFFSLLALWSAPVMTVNTLWFNIAATLYFMVGSRVEEERLVRIYGEEYRTYRRDVPWLIPLPPSRRRSGEAQAEP